MSSVGGASHAHQFHTYNSQAKVDPSKRNVTTDNIVQQTKTGSKEGMEGYIKDLEGAVKAAETGHTDVHIVIGDKVKGMQPEDAKAFLKHLKHLAHDGHVKIGDTAKFIPYSTPIQHDHSLYDTAVHKVHAAHKGHVVAEGIEMAAHITHNPKIMGALASALGKAGVNVTGKALGHMIHGALHAAGPVIGGLSAMEHIANLCKIATGHADMSTTDFLKEVGAGHVSFDDFSVDNLSGHEAEFANECVKLCLDLGACAPPPYGFAFAAAGIGYDLLENLEVKDGHQLAAEAQIAFGNKEMGDTVAVGANIDDKMGGPFKTLEQAKHKVAEIQGGNWNISDDDDFAIMMDDQGQFYVYELDANFAWDIDIDSNELESIVIHDPYVQHDGRTLKFEGFVSDEGDFGKVELKTYYNGDVGFNVNKKGKVK